MIEHLATLVDTFPGAANQTRCFAHILNLVAKSILRQFESPKANTNKAMAEAAEELAAVPDEIDREVPDSGLEDNEDEINDVDDDVVDSECHGVTTLNDLGYPNRQQSYVKEFTKLVRSLSFEGDKL